MASFFRNLFNVGKNIFSGIKTALSSTAPKLGTFGQIGHKVGQVSNVLSKLGVGGNLVKTI